METVPSYGKQHERKEGRDLLKFPKIQHVPWSCSVARDDRQFASEEEIFRAFEGKEVVYMEKMDGENTVFSSERISARSTSGGYGKPWQVDMLKRWEAIRHDIPEEITIYGENMTGVHAVLYDTLDDFFYVFGVTEETEDGLVYLSYEDILGYAEALGLKIAPTIKSGSLEKFAIPEKSSFGPTCEGYVVRNVESFPIEGDAWNQNIAKCVREGHVQPGSDHWTKGWKRNHIHWR